MQNGFPKITFAKGQTLISPGNQPKFLIYLKKGLVQQFVQNTKGEKLVIHQYQPGSLFHLKWLFSSEPNNYHFGAVTSVTAFQVPKVQALKLFKQDPDFLWQITKRLIKGLDGLSKRLEIVTLNPASFRVASLLSYLEKKYGRPLPFKLTHQEIASWVGTARETVSLEMGKLKKAGNILKNYSS